MSTPYETTPLTEEHLKLYPISKIIVVRLFVSPYHWYAGILASHELDGTKCIIELKSSVRFERQAQKSIWLPENSLVQAVIDRAIAGTKDKVLKFTLNEPQMIVHPIFEKGNGIAGISSVEGFTHLSYRGSDVLAIGHLLEKA